MALLQIEAGQSAEACRRLRRVLAIVVDAIEARLALADAALRGGLPVEAVQHFRAVRDRSGGLLAAELGLAAALHDLRDRAAALHGFCRAATGTPNSLEAVGSVGLILLELGRTRQAALWFKRALALLAQSPPALHNLAHALREADPAGARRTLRRLLALAPTLADAHRDIAEACLAALHIEGATRHVRRALVLEPRSASILCTAAMLWNRTFDRARSRRAVRAAIALTPDLVGALNLAGMWHDEIMNEPEAVICYQRALALEPLRAELWGNLGRAHLRGNLVGLASRPLRRAISLTPKSSGALGSLALAALLVGDDGKALSWCGRALTIDPLAAVARTLRGGVRRNQGRLTEAAAECRRALSVAPSDADAHLTLGTALQDLAAPAAAADAYRRAFTSRPGYVEAERNLLYALLHLPDLDEPTIFRAARSFASRHRPARLQGMTAWPNERSPDRPLRVAYVSSDFRDHPNRWFMNALFEHRNRAAWSLYCYYTHPRADEETRNVHARADRWRDAATMSDADLATQLREDQIDIAVLVSGRFDGNRPMVAAYRAAPIQVSYLDGGTSGLAEMDYWITDGMLHPEQGTKEQFTEELYRLPVFYSFTRPMPAVAVSPLPASVTGGVTFGSFAQPARVTERVIATWAEILAAVPGSRLLLKSRNRYGDPSNQRRLFQSFATHGIAVGRIAVESGMDDHASHLRRYERVDIALDTFPFSGATTSFEALWMGVPVVTWAGARFVSRMAAAILTPLGLSECIAASCADYVANAIALARDRDRLAALRQSLRARAQASPLCDGKAYAESMETAHRSMWRRWCVERNS
ncbi:MAG: tetratricopeptide repeat protein [Proteobacteria bacterium]|nr:tetratricopeptide repeat protein [Pseudomonadota bacterium]